MAEGEEPWAGGWLQVRGGAKPWARTSEATLYSGHVETKS